MLELQYREELDPLQERDGRVLGFLEDAALEREQAELSIEIERRIVKQADGEVDVGPALGELVQTLVGDP